MGSMSPAGPDLYLALVFEGWEGYQASLQRAIPGLTTQHLAWRASAGVRSLGEVIRHLCLGRITWLARLNPPGIEEAVARVPQWHVDPDGARHAVEDAVPCDSSAILSEWLETSWRPVREILDQWTVHDLSVCYTHRFRGTDYRVSRQWTIWRVLSHDLHHGGQIALMLAVLGVEAFELRALGGHIVAPPLAGNCPPVRETTPYPEPRPSSN